LTGIAPSGRTEGPKAFREWANEARRRKAGGPVPERKRTLRAKERTKQK